jgi:hypothetical protein
MDQDTRDYFFELMKSMSKYSKDYVLVSLYGYLEGISPYSPEHLEFMMNKIQIHSDAYHGID